jgi:hypothetical protein
MFGGFEKSLLSVTNHTTTAVGEKKYVLWNVHPDWVVLQIFTSQDFQISGVHRTEPISFSVVGTQEDFSIVSKALEKKLKKFPR